jgi:hypothetical protein
MLMAPRRWRVGSYVIEETEVVRDLWLLGSDDVRKLDTLPPAMTDRDVARLRIGGIGTVADMLACIVQTVALVGPIMAAAERDRSV